MKAVAVYSAADGAARHIHEADEAVLLGSGPQDLPYQDIRALIEAAQRSGCQAVHPGCGALATSPSFADAVADNGLVWVGPAPRTLAAIADPAVLRGALSGVGAAFASSAEGPPDAETWALGVPVLVGHGEPIGLPPRQLLGAGRLVVECPVPDLPSTAAAAAIRAAEQAALAVELRGLATVTVIVGATSDRAPAAAVAGLWPALDFEHPVVEAVTDLDLVQQQISVSTGGDAVRPAAAASRAAALAQVRATAPRGRVAKISSWREPRREHVRVDSGFAAGDSVPPGGARVLATVTGWGSSREKALAALAGGLETFEVTGVAVDLDDAQQEVARRRASGSEGQRP
jgi:acetyl/propionyl-CoA carboxylase alpha subunit